MASIRNVRLYYDLMSQPSRSLYMFMKAAKIPFTPQPVALRKGAHFSDEFKKINPLSRVPVIDDGGFVLTESIAIMKYLSVKYNVADHWYPRDLQARARVDEYMSWHHIGLRVAAASFFRELLIEPVARGERINRDKVERFRKHLNTSLDALEMMFLKRPYVSGDEISIADVLGVCELTELYAVGEEKMFTQRPAVNGWISRVQERLQPHFDESHQILFRTKDTFLKMQKASKL